MDEVDRFREFCPEPGESRAAHREQVVLMLIQDGAQSSDRRSLRGLAVALVSSLVAVILAATIVVGALQHPAPMRSVDLSPMSVRLDENLRFVGVPGWHARPVRVDVSRSDRGPHRFAEALRISNFRLPPDAADDANPWARLYPALHGGRVIIDVTRMGSTRPDVDLGPYPRRRLPIQLAPTELRTNFGGVVQVAIQVWLHHRGTWYRIGIATDMDGASGSPADALATVNRGLAGLR